MSTSSNTSNAAKLALRSIGLLIGLLGLLVIYAFIAMCADVFLHIWVHPALSGIAIELLITLGGVASGVYVIYLAYLLAFRSSRKAFERIYFIVFIFVIVVVGRGFSVVGTSLVAAGMAILALVLRPIITKRLFRDEDY
jgi:hypothetical protein